MNSLNRISILLLFLFVSACSRDAQIASKNLSRASDMFEIDRRIVFYNGINGQYMLNIEGKCSILEEMGQLEVTCKIGDNEYKKHFLGLSDNVTYFVQQLEPKGVSVYRHRVIFKPETIIPDVEVRTSERKELIKIKGVKKDK